MKKLTIGLVGNPNCGKSTIFNGLTGARQQVGNWPGVTIERKSGLFNHHNQQVQVIDLPGIYQLSYSNHQQAIDERIACEFIVNCQADIIVNIIDAAHLERHLYLTLQLLEMNVPVIVAVNMLDVAKRRKIELDLTKLATLLGCPVVGLIASKGCGIQTLKKTIVEHSQPHNTSPFHYPELLQEPIAELAQQITQAHPHLAPSARWLAQQLLEETDRVDLMTDSIRQQAIRYKNQIEREQGEEIDIVLADCLYTTAHSIHQEVSSAGDKQPSTYSDKIDKVVLNRWLGIPIFLAVMYTMFLFAINLGGAFQDFFDISSDTLFVKGVFVLLNKLHSPHWLIALLAAGLGRGINTTISFIPVIGAMFLFLAFLEGSGYMARASFVIDRLMRSVGLPGKSFVPMIVGFGCNVPAILAARTLDTERDRTLTVLMSPFMSCGARLAIFAVFTAAFFPSGGQNVVFALYLIGIMTAILTGFILRKTVLQGDVTPMILELPAYHLPSLSALLKSSWYRLKSFIFRAGKLIIPICMLIGLLNAINSDGTLNTETSSANSVLAAIGRGVTPILSPMGIESDNWPATVGLVTGVLAKEVVVATLNTLYAQENHLTTNTTSSSNIIDGFKLALVSIPQNLLALKDSLTNPIASSSPENKLDHAIYGVMYQRFNGPVAAFAYLLFVLLYFPCISATAVMAKELNKRWALFSVLWSTGIAYAVATSFYQLATFYLHPEYSLTWLLMIAALLGGTLSLLKRMSSSPEKQKRFEYAINKT